jgi:myo-inositol 2-dehydrogenase/D-chiro-inositol 1-dehydrogenase
MGGTHAENLYARVVGARLAAVMDVDQARAAEVAARCGSARVFQDLVQLIGDDAVDAVVIASPDETHAEMVLECLRVEKPVLCEKPLATKLADAQKVIDAEVALGRKLVQVGFMRRYDPQHLGVKQAIDSGVIGRPILFRGWHRSITVPKGISNETILVNSAIHDFDSARWFLGQEIEEVYVRGTNTEPALGGDVLDLQLIQMSLAGGCLATIEVYETATYGYEVGVEIVGDRGAVLIGTSPEPVIRHDRAKVQRVESGWLERFATAYVTELQAWIDSLKGIGLAGPDAWDGYASLLAAEGCQESLRSGLPHRLLVSHPPSLYDED